MAYQGVLDDIRKAVRLEKPARLPVFAASEEFDVRVAGAVYGEYNRNAELMAKVQIECVEKFDYDWAWLQVDDCIEFEVLGVGVRGEGDILPATCDYLKTDYSVLRGLKMPDPQKDGRMPVLLESIKRIKDKFGDTVCVTGRVAAPFTSTTLIFGMVETFSMMYDDPDFIFEANKFCLEMQNAFAVAQIKAGADALWVGDCNASGHLISPDQFREFAFDGAKQLAKTIDEYNGLSIYHASEHNLECLDIQADIGNHVLSVGPGRDMAEAKAKVGHKVCLVGNIDPIKYLYYADADKVYNEAKRIASIGSNGGGYLFNSGEMIPRDTPEENIKAMIRGARDAN